MKEFAEPVQVHFHLDDVFKPTVSPQQLYKGGLGEICRDGGFPPSKESELSFLFLPSPSATYLSSPSPFGEGNFTMTRKHTYNFCGGRDCTLTHIHHVFQSGMVMNSSPKIKIFTTRGNFGSHLQKQKGWMSQNLATDVWKYGSNCHIKSRKHFSVSPFLAHKHTVGIMCLKSNGCAVWNNTNMLFIFALFYEKERQG